MPLTVPTETTPMTLVVAWRPATKVHARKINIRGDVAEKLREFAGHAAGIATNGEWRAYDPDETQDEASHIRADRAEAWDVELLTEIDRGDDLPVADKDDLKRQFTCYALVVGDASNRTLYIRKGNPVVLGRKPLLAGLLDNSIAKIVDPIFAFDDAFDVIVTAEQLYAIDKDRFEKLFKDSDAVLEKAGEWVDAVVENLPLTDGSRDSLVEIVRKNSIVRRKLHSIARRSYVKELTTDRLKTKMLEHGLDADVLMPAGKLDFSPANVTDLLRLINEDLFRGDFSNQEFAASAKRRAGD